MWRVMEAHPYSLCLIDDTFFFDEFDFPSPYRFLTRKSRSATSLLLGSDLYDLSERVSALESTVHRLVNATTAAAAAGKYSWTAEFNDHGIERKYQWTARIKGGNKKHVSNKKNYKWTSEIKGGGEHAPLRRYTLEVTNAASKPNPKTKRASRAVEIEEVNNPGALVIRQRYF
uniref:Uncharacterized protein n=1 Tax=Kalanchoe fedtschenkoi TaxID=63787 RepID=A0A7N0SZ18_KALFE